MWASIWYKGGINMSDSINIKWGAYILADIFEISSTLSGIDKNKLILNIGNTPYITRTENNNGWERCIGIQNNRYKVDDGNCISIGLDTQTVFYQSVSFYTGQNIQTLRNQHLNKYNAKFIISMIDKLMIKFNWGGNGATLTRLKRSKILLPQLDDGQPDYQFMERYMKNKETEQLGVYRKYIHKRIQKLPTIQSDESIASKQWHPFYLKDLFTFVKGDQNNMAQLPRGVTPLISAKKNDNGCKSFVSNERGKTYKGNCLTLNNDGDGGAGLSFYHPYDFVLDSHVTALIPKTTITESQLLFLSLCISKQRSRFGHGYAINANRLKAFQLLLPVEPDGTPNWKFMEQYMKNIELKQLTAYLQYIDNR